MSVFESLTRFWQGSVVVIALTFLVVGHLPALNVGATQAESVTLGKWIEVGKCHIDYAE